jgi:hypothetical protein
MKLGTYHNWLNDVVLLCRSHHSGYDELAGSAFNPRYVGAPGAVLHLRYLACALRVADVLDFDPERTPDVILRHREIPPESLIYWWKDKELSIHRDGHRYVVYARPSGARIQKALEVTLDQLDAELSLSRRLADETHFEKCPGLQADLPHRWNLHPVAHPNIEPGQQAYEYIDGSFRPNTERVLDLLS